MMWKQLWTAVVLLILMTVLTGILYPLMVTGIAQLVFPFRANGSQIQHGGKIVGSELIGQSFDDPRYFWGRLSATSPSYNGGASSGSNYGPMNPALSDSAKARMEVFHKADPGNTAPIPVDLVTSSGSGLDPDISIAAALYQTPRVARVRGIDEEKVRQLVLGQVEDRQMRFLGEKRVNILLLNLALDGLQ
jgi:potassium-transporting ATPase KdpC subunit